MKYKKKPVIIEAFRLGIDYIPYWFMDEIASNKVTLYCCDDTNADIKTLEGIMHVEYGDYVIRGITGEIYPCKPDIFEKTYELVD